MNQQRTIDLTFFTEPTSGDVFELMADGFSMIEDRLNHLEDLILQEKSLHLA
jgi:hypothetical protein